MQNCMYYLRVFLCAHCRIVLVNIHHNEIVWVKSITKSNNSDKIIGSFSGSSDKDIANSIVVILLW